MVCYHYHLLQNVRVNIQTCGRIAANGIEYDTRKDDSRSPQACTGVQNRIGSSLRTQTHIHTISCMQVPLPRRCGVVPV